MINIELSKVDNRFIRETNDFLKILRGVPCQLLITGYKLSKMCYKFCLSCDPEMKEPICDQCNFHCHKDHKIVEGAEIEAICSCGIKCHQTKKDLEAIDTKYITRCLFGEWSTISK